MTTVNNFSSINTKSVGGGSSTGPLPERAGNRPMRVISDGPTEYDNTNFLEAMRLLEEGGHNLSPFDISMNPSFSLGTCENDPSDGRPNINVTSRLHDADPAVIASVILHETVHGNDMIQGLDIDVNGDGEISPQESSSVQEEFEAIDLGFRFYQQHNNGSGVPEFMREQYETWQQGEPTFRNYLRNGPYSDLPEFSPGHGLNIQS